MVYTANQQTTEHLPNLFDLPAEISNYICTLILTVQPSEDGTVLLVKPALPGQGQTLSVLTLLLVCRRILSEAEDAPSSNPQSRHRDLGCRIHDQRAQGPQKIPTPEISDHAIWDPRIRSSSFLGLVGEILRAASKDSLQRETARISPLVRKLESLLELHIGNAQPDWPDQDDVRIEDHLRGIKDQWN